MVITVPTHISFTVSVLAAKMLYLSPVLSPEVKRIYVLFTFFVCLWFLFVCLFSWLRLKFFFFLEGGNRVFKTSPTHLGTVASIYEFWTSLKKSQYLKLMPLNSWNHVHDSTLIGQSNSSHCASFSFLKQTNKKYSISNNNKIPVKSKDQDRGIRTEKWENKLCICSILCMLLR